MKYNHIFNKKIGCQNPDEVFNYLMNSLKKSITHWNYFVNWEKSEGNLREVEINLNILNYLIGKNDIEKLNSIFNAHPDLKFICIDVANGYSEHFVDFVKKTRDNFPDKIIMAGNVVTGEMVEELLISGADIVKVGIGPGSVCTTRVKTAVGYPQLSAIIECADAAHGLGGQIISDGGCTIPGDLSKAFGAGADFVMLGGMFAGHDESGGETFEENGKFEGLEWNFEVGPYHFSHICFKSEDLENM